MFPRKSIIASAGNPKKLSIRGAKDGSWDDTSLVKISVSGGIDPLGRRVARHFHSRRSTGVNDEKCIASRNAVGH